MSTFFAPSYFATSFFGGLGNVPEVEDVLVVIENEVANWLADTLAVEVYPLAIPQSTVDYPVLVYTIIGHDPYLRLSGPGGMARARFQLDAYSNVYADAATLHERLRLALVKFVRGMNRDGTAPMGSATIRDLALHDGLAGYAPTETGQDNRGVYRRMTELALYYDQDVLAPTPPPPASAPVGYFGADFFAASYFAESYF